MPCHSESSSARFSPPRCSALRHFRPPGYPVVDDDSLSLLQFASGGENRIGVHNLRSITQSAVAYSPDDNVFLLAFIAGHADNADRETLFFQVHDAATGAPFFGSAVAHSR